MRNAEEELEKAEMASPPHISLESHFHPPGRIPPVPFAPGRVAEGKSASPAPVEHQMWNLMVTMGREVQAPPPPFPFPFKGTLSKQTRSESAEAQANNDTGSRSQALKIHGAGILKLFYFIMSRHQANANK